MDMKYRGCQDEEPLEECISKHYIDNLLHQCNCLPLRIATSKNVTIIIIYGLISFQHNTLIQDPICNPEQLACIENVKLNSSKCVKSCTGLIVTGYTKFEFDDLKLVDIEKTIEAYKDFKKWFKVPLSIKGNLFPFPLR